MQDFFNWHDTWIVAEHNVAWLIVAFGIGVFIGWRTCDPASGNAG